MTERRMTAERWADVAYWPLLIASVAFIVAYSWQVIADLPFPHRGWTVAVLLVTWVIFVVDYLARLWLADHRGRWFRTHIFDLLVVVLPPLRPLRLLRTLGAARHRRKTRGDELRSRIALYGALSAAILIWFAALAELEVERDAPGATIVSMGDSVWWAFVTIATVGYGDYSPVTVAGRVIAVGLMAGGVAVLGVTAASISSWIIEQAAGGRDDNEAATRGQMRALARQVEAFGARLGTPADPAAVAATDEPPAPRPADAPAGPGATSGAGSDSTAETPR